MKEYDYERCFRGEDIIGNTLLHCICYGSADKPCEHCPYHIKETT